MARYDPMLDSPSGGGGDSRTPVFGSPVYNPPSPVYVAPAPSYGSPGPSWESPPYIPQAPGVSRTGPTASVQPMAAADSAARVGSIFGGISSPAAFRASRSVQRQRGFNVQAQEQLRRRKRNRFGLAG